MYVNNFTLSGYGDRMIDLFLFSIISILFNETVHIYWETFRQSYHSLPSWRSKDTTLTNFLSMFKLPCSLQLHDTIFRCTDKPFQHYFGGTVSPHKLYSILNLNVDSVIYNSIVNDLKQQFSLKVPFYSPETPYTVIHLRRSDKVRSKDVDEGMIHQKELEELDIETKKAIQSLGFKTFYIASDDPVCKQEYTNYITSLGYTVIQPENKHNLLESYFDTWMMFSSSAIIVSMRYSNFSLFPALIRNIPLYTVLPPDRYYELGFHHHVNITYYKNIQLDN
jgi:hypothetical protein